MIDLRLGDCRDVMATLEADSVDAIVCDPPYGLGFMGKGWDHGVPGLEFWAAAQRVAKPGAHLLAFGGTRTFHRLTCAIEDAGWEIRDCLSWLYGSGFPKSLDVSKAIDKAAGVEREDKFEGSFERRAGPTGNRKCDTCGKWLVSGTPCQCPRPQDQAVTDAAQARQGWGTALKPAWEPIILARKPLNGTVAANVLKHGVGAINIDASRIEGPQGDGVWGSSNATTKHERTMGDGLDNPDFRTEQHPAGRWPANVVLDEEAARLVDRQSGTLQSGEANIRRDSGADRWGNRSAAFGAESRMAGDPMVSYGDMGGASRFFYCAKASRSEREAGLEGLPSSTVSVWGGEEDDLPETMGRSLPARNHHPTVKPVDLMRWLVKLVTPVGGLVLDPFMGSGTTGIAAVLERMRFIGIEREVEYLAIAKARIGAAAEQGLLNL